MLVIQIIDRYERLDRPFQQDPFAETDEDHHDGEDAVRSWTKDRGKDREKDQRQCLLSDPLGGQPDHRWEISQTSRDPGATPVSPRLVGFVGALARGVVPVRASAAHHLKGFPSCDRSRKVVTASATPRLVGADTSRVTVARAKPSRSQRKIHRFRSRGISGISMIGDTCVKPLCAQPVWIVPRARGARARNLIEGHEDASVRHDVPPGTEPAS